MPFPAKLIIAVSGQPGAGKSTLARQLADLAGGRTASFGSYLRVLAAKCGLGEDRATLQSLGEELVHDDPVVFTTGFLDWARAEGEGALVVDGVRHVTVDEVLRAWAGRAGARYRAVVVTAPIRLRAKARTAGDLELLRVMDEHPTERQATGELLARADHILQRPWSDAEAQAVLTG